MSATVVLHPSVVSRIPQAKRPKVMLMWAQSMQRRGMITDDIKLSSGELLLAARPPETARSNATRQKMPRYRNQFHGQPDGAA